MPRMLLLLLACAHGFVMPTPRAGTTALKRAAPTTALRTLPDSSLLTAFTLQAPTEGQIANLRRFLCVAPRIS